MSHRSMSYRGSISVVGCALTVALAALGCSSSDDTTVSGTGGAGGTGNTDGGTAGADSGTSNQCGASVETYTATGTDNSAVVADGTSKDLTNATVTSDSVTSSQDNSSFYGLNAAVLAKNGGKITMSCVSVTTTGAGANGVFASGTGSSIAMSKVTINCVAEGGHGVDATLGAVLSLQDVDITTAGAHGAAIATDRGSGTITVTGGTVVTSGVDSPGIYSTGVITVSTAKISATGAEAAVIEGANSISLTDTALSAAKGTRDRGLMVYQSMSGDAEGNKGTFTMLGGSFTWTSSTGPLVYVTNTNAVISLKGVTINSSSGTFLKAAADQWGTSGSNGGVVQLTADGQTMAGNIEIDAVSSLTATLQNSSSLTGAINAGATAKTVDVTMDSGSTWNVGADSVLTTLTDSDATFANVVSNGHSVCYKGSVNGASTGSYSLAGGGALKPCS